MEEDKINYKIIYGSNDYLNILKLADGKLQTNDGYTFQIHRIILYKSSSYFQALFFGMATEKREFRIPGISGEILSDILSYIYTGNISLNQNNLTDLMIAADYLLLDKLLLNVETYAQDNISLDNCVSILLASQKTSKEDLERDTFRFIELHFEEIINDPKYRFTEIPLEILKRFLLSKSLNITSERTLWMAIVKWVQKDPRRQDYVLYLLTYLEKGELDETLAKNIVEHSIVADNSSCKDLHLHNSEISSTGYLDVLLQLLESKSCSSVDKHNYRIPPRLYIIAEIKTRGKDEYSDVYITYDENFDFLRKITTIDFQMDFLLAIEFKIFMFECEADKCLVYDMETKSKTPVEEVIFTEQRYNVEKVLNINHNICMLQYPFDEMSQSHMYYIEIYDTLSESWLHEILVPNIFYADITCISKKLYLLGCNPDMNSMTAQMYDLVSDTWSYLPSPRSIRCDFAFVAFHEKLYVIGGSTEIGVGFLRTVEMFDPIENVWTELPDLPCGYRRPCAIVLNDNIIVYDNIRLSKTSRVRWNEAKQMWESLKVKTLRNDLYFYRFGLIENAEVIRFLLNENRGSGTEFVEEFIESPLGLKEIFTE